LSLAMIFATFA